MELVVPDVRVRLAIVAIVAAIVVVALVASDVASLVDVGSWRWSPRRMA